MSGGQGSSTTIVKKLPVKKESGDIGDVTERAVTKYLDWARDIHDSTKEFAGYYDKYTYKGRLDTAGGRGTYALQNDDELDGIANLADRGQNGDTLIAKGKTYITDVLDGDYLKGANAEFTTMLGNLIDKPKKAYRDNIFNKLGGSVYCVGNFAKDNLAQELNESDRYFERLSARVYARNYASEVGKREHAIGYGVEYGKQAVEDAEYLRSAGLAQRIYEQGSLEDAYRDWFDTEVQKIRKLEVWGNAVRSLVGTHTAITKPYYRPNPIMGVMGGAMVGAGAGFMITGTPMGAAIGAGVGGLLGGIATL